MPLTETTAAGFDPDRAADLLRLLDLEAQWESLRASPTWHDPAGGLAGLRARQKGYDAYRTGLLAYQARYGTTFPSGPAGGNPARFAGWCRALRALCLRAGTETAPAALLEKAFAAAERMGARLGVAVERPTTPPADVREAADAFDGLARWCDRAAAPPVVERAA